ncbi:raffinose/stachyose/melibiose transport system substrate-binding protein [Anaerocolumna jejuensis DSM 15929]|uniref:Raffinose/stachyose/melibiose transport system substrate-binding protein n=1 Tax=Anaerocolumna jejuensis DSM 15929 TaxID=1121322 RepID=A0A1M6JDX9_9FIRM|nr:extracellular solute-binding protein [Anaerocolumna jejuensis]SHJ44897.1 raffinose/stachyose/melibiose transport system substrate-binding protein [Anaerocolumna jejuensis DSM 15929]
MVFKKLSAIFLIAALTAASATGCSSNKIDTSADKAKVEGNTTASPTASTDAGTKKYEGVTLSILRENSMSAEGLNAVLKAATDELGMKFDVETYVSGSDGDNIIKTRLASGEMSDLCIYNAGSLLTALNPSEYFADISNEEAASRLDDTFKSTVTVDGAVYGVPFNSAAAGAVLYYKPDYKELGLSVPKTWEEFLANCDALQKAGKTALIGTFGDSWTSQVLFLGDNYNVLAAQPDFPKKFEAGENKYATTKAGLRSFEKMADVSKYYNKDYLAATYNDGVDMLANGEGSQWIMLTQVLSNIFELYPEKVNDIGVFAIPGDNPDDNGLTVWMPNALYVNKESKNEAAALAFINFYTFAKALDAYSSSILPDGPYCIKNYKLPDNAYDAVKTDMQAYFDAGKTAVALEFLTSVKGPNCAAITQEVGTGQATAKEAAKAYDEDCKKQAVQLGLNWK